jgi:RNA polymerase sigma factor (sigma-70 family)
MTWRLALDRRRGDRRRQARESQSVPVGFASGEPQAAGASHVDDLVARERAEHLWSAIDALPEKIRVVVVLANIEGHDIAEVARLLALPAGTVKSRLFVARQRLKEHLQWMRNDSTR